MPGVVYLNGEFLPRERATLSVDDRGFIFGDGIYEVTRVVNGRLFEADRHMRRLDYGLRGIGINPPLSADELIDIHYRLIQENGLTTGEGTVYLQITRGAAPRTHYFPPATTRPTVFLSASPFTPNDTQRQNGATAVTYPDIRWSRCDLKTVNLLGAVLAKQHAVASGSLEAVFIRDGVITEGSHTNVFGVIDGELRTYPRSNYILSGITRDVVLELAAEEGINVREAPILQQEIGRLDELFVTGTTSDVTPIVQLDGRPIGSGKPGPITRQLVSALQRRLYATAPAAELATAR
ncbi:MAG TPA: D-amino-acid transaminase [Gemmatimonadaceae bacterium]|jgi:D-alanine transaminase|nr:D-amino-acid transaminase [Gemmatimonadaceae bacterium]